MPSRITASPRLPPVIWRSANSSASWPPGWGMGPQPRCGGQAVRPCEPPGGDGDSPREHGLERADRRQLLDHRGLEASELLSVLLRQHHVLLRPHAVLERISRGARLPSGVLGPREFAPLRRLASARALVTGTAARCAAPALDMAVILGWRPGTLGEKAGMRNPAERLLLYPIIGICPQGPPRPQSQAPSCHTRIVEV